MSADAAPVERTIVGRLDSLRFVFRSKTLVIGCAILLFWVLCAILGTLITPADPLAQSANLLQGPSGAHPFGTDALGRDVLSRVLAGSRSILTVAPAATVLGVALGTALGLVAGFFRGLVDEIINRIVDAVLALPFVVTAVIVLVAIGRSTITLIIVIGVVFAPVVSRTVRASVLVERELEYIESARLRGEGSLYIMFAEILPNVLGPIIVEGTVRLGYAIFAVAGLTFLGFGVQPPSPDWALQISDNYTLLNTGTDWWTVLFPALAIGSLVVATNFVADGLAHGMD